jgi:hypothetical protein
MRVAHYAEYPQPGAPPLASIYPAKNGIIAQSARAVTCPASSQQVTGCTPAINMSHNTVRARLSLSFKGESYDLDSVIDLDRCHGEPGEAPNFHQLLARAAGIDPYSYLYDALESHEIEFSEATGAAARSCRDGRFDWAQYEQDRDGAQDWQAVRAIAERFLPARDLDAEPELKAALLAAYRAGKAN